MNDIQTHTGHPLALELAQKFSTSYGGYPNPDGDPPHGPWWGPWIWKAVDRAALNLRVTPQLQQLDLSMQPHPDPWRIAFTVAFAQVVIEKIVDLHEIGEALSGESRQGVQRHAMGMMARLADEYCGTRPKPLPFPGRRGFVFEPVELMVIAGQLDIASRFAGAGAEVLAGGAARFAEAGSRGRV